MPKPRPSRSKTPPLGDVIQQLCDLGWLQDAQHADERLILCKEGPSWAAIPREACKLWGGTWHCTGSSVRWHYGRKSFYFLPYEREAQLRKARALTLEVTGKEPGWGFGSCARAFLEWAIPNRPPDLWTRFLPVKRFCGYRQVLPDTYKHARSFDLNANYSTLISRLKTPFVRLNERGQIVYDPHVPGTPSKARWAQVLELLAEEKYIRNAMWGAMLGSLESSSHWHAGERKESSAYYGHAWGAAALVGRSAWEICREQCEQASALFAHTDGIILPELATPDYWKSLDLPYKSDYVGPTHIIHEANYKIGAHKSRWYDPESNMAEVKPLKRREPRTFHLEWLRN